MSQSIYIFIMLLLSLSAFARSEKYQLKGSYQLNSSINKPVEYSLSWAEEDGQIKGVYSDNYFSKRAEVIGEDGKEGRTFKVVLPEIKRGVQSINILTSVAGVKDVATTIPVSIITRDAKGNPLTNAEVQGNLSQTRIVAQRQEEECREGFGALAGYCGIYEGLIAENVDRQNKCNLLFADAVRLEFDAAANLTLYMGQVEQIFTTPGHLIGRVPSKPGTNRIDVMSRSCRNLPGIESKNEYCKRLNLVGQFTMIGQRRHFAGTYTIFDEGTKNTCSYTLSMDQ